MNAYELADELQKFYDELDGSFGYLEQSINILRQQADRIVELEKEITRLIGAEPITYGTFTVCKNCGQQDPYTQTKPLSDEEIVEIYKSVKQDKDLTWEEWCITWEEWCKEQIEFARAIEERILGK